jgi:hypothetical protein
MIIHFELKRPVLLGTTTVYDMGLMRASPDGGNKTKRVLIAMLATRLHLALESNA